MIASSISSRRRHQNRAVSGALLFLWLAPVAALLVFLGPDDVFSRIATFFSQMAVVTFGGAYAVLAYAALADATLTTLDREALVAADGARLTLTYRSTDR